MRAGVRGGAGRVCVGGSRVDAPPLSPGARRRRCSQEHAFVLTMGAGTRVYGYCRRFISVDTDGTGRLDMGEHRTMFCFCVLSRRYVCGTRCCSCQWRDSVAAAAQSTLHGACGKHVSVCLSLQARALSVFASSSSELPQPRRGG